MYKSQLNYIGLSNLQYELIDTSTNSDNYFNVIEMPDVFTGGKNLIRIRPKNDNLVPGSTIYIEIIDANGNPIYHEILNYIGSDKSRAISVFIYPDTAPGNATVYFATRAYIADTGIQSAPIDSNSNPNILWTRDILVSPITRNKSDILFVREPIVIVNERIVKYHEPDNTALLDVDGIRYSRKKTTSGSTAIATVEMISQLHSDDVISDTEYSHVLQESQYDTSRKLNIQTMPSASNDGGVSGRYLSTRKSSRNVIFAKNYEFNKDMIGGTIYVQNANISNYLPGDVLTPASYSPVPTVYSSSIIRVINSSSIEVHDPFLYSFDYTTTVGTTKSTAITRFAPTYNFTCSYMKADWIESESETSKSYAECIFTDIAPATGDIFRIKTYYKPMGMYGDFIDNGESVVNSYNILRSTSYLTQSISDGMVELELYNVNADNYRTFFTSSIVNITDASTSVSMSYNNANLIGGIRAELQGSGSFGTTSYYSLHTCVGGALGLVTPAIVAQQPLIYKNTHYSVDFNAFCELNSSATSSATDPNLRVDVYIDNLSGAAAPNIIVEPTNNKLPISNLVPIRGHTYLGTVSGKPGTRFDNNSFSFYSLIETRVRLVFVIRAGTWTFNEIKLNALRENGFSPNYVRLMSYIPPTANQTELIFKFQYFNYDGRMAATETLVYGVLFDGSSALPGAGTLTGTIPILGELDMDGIVIASKPIIAYTVIHGAVAITAGTGGGP